MDFRDEQVKRNPSESEMSTTSVSIHENYSPVQTMRVCFTNHQENNCINWDKQASRNYR
jgi:hypothetical protein